MHIPLWLWLWGFLNHNMEHICGFTCVLWHFNKVLEETWNKYKQAFGSLRCKFFKQYVGDFLFICKLMKLYCLSIVIGYSQWILNNTTVMCFWILKLNNKSHKQTKTNNELILLSIVCVAWYSFFVPWTSLLPKTY